MAPLNIPPLAGRVGELESFHCQSAEDECHGPLTCPDPPSDDCAYDPSCEFYNKHFICSGRLLYELCFAAP